MAKDDRLRFMQLDIDDIEQDPNWITMGSACRGAYITLLMHQWRQGYLPSDPRKLMMIAREIPTTWADIWPHLEPLFTIAGEQCFNKRCKKDRERVENRRKTLVAKGKKGAQVRWHSHSPGYPPGNAHPMAKEKVKVKEKVKGTSEVECSTENLSKQGGGNSELLSGRSIFDRDGIITKLQARYAVGRGDDEFSADEHTRFHDLLSKIAPKQTQRLGLLQQLADHSRVAILLALADWDKLDDPPNRPAPFFVAMVRDRGGKAARMQDKWDQQKEEKQRHEQTRQAHQGQDTTTAHRSHPAGFHTVGDVLRNLPEVRRTPGGEPDARAPETDQGDG